MICGTTCVRVESDNATVVCAISSGSSRDRSVMHLGRVLQFLAARHGFSSWLLTLRALVI